jgi:hypothetical protein
MERRRIRRDRLCRSKMGRFRRVRIFLRREGLVRARRGLVLSLAVKVKLDLVLLLVTLLLVAPQPVGKVTHRCLVDRSSRLRMDRSRLVLRSPPLVELVELLLVKLAVELLLVELLVEPLRVKLVLAELLMDPPLVKLVLVKLVLVKLVLVDPLLVRLVELAAVMSAAVSTRLKTDRSKHLYFLDSR